MPDDKLKQAVDLSNRTVDNLDKLTKEQIKAARDEVVRLKTEWQQEQKPSNFLSNPTKPRDVV